MKSFSKQTIVLIDGLTSELAALSNDLVVAIDTYNKAIEERRDAVSTALSAYNENLSDLRALYKQLHEDAGDYFNERSERWQEGESGQAYSEWLDSMKNIEGIDEIEIEFPDELELPDGIPVWADASSFLPVDKPE